MFSATSGKCHAVYVALPYEVHFFFYFFCVYLIGAIKQLQGIDHFFAKRDTHQGEPFVASPEFHPRGVRLGVSAMPGTYAQQNPPTYIGAHLALPAFFCNKCLSWWKATFPGEKHAESKWKASGKQLFHQAKSQTQPGNAFSLAAPTFTPPRP